MPFSKLLLACIASLLSLVTFSQLNISSLQATEVQFPVVEPLNTIFVEAETVAKEVRGAYDVLAFEGKCQLKQGELQATGDRITLWLERRSHNGVDLPGKIICQIDGRADVNWNATQRLDEKPLRLQDNRWMGRLFSLHPVDYRVQREVTRHDIPNLDWNFANPNGAVQQAQYTQSTNSQALAPPLLGAPPLLPTDLTPPSSNSGATISSGQLPQPKPASNATQIPPTPGAVQWTPNGSTTGNGLIPSTGLVIPDDGSQPYPAAGLPPASVENIPPFPPAGQVALQVPTDATKSWSRNRFEFLPRGNGELNFSLTS